MKVGSPVLFTPTEQQPVLLTPHELAVGVLMGETGPGGDVLAVCNRLVGALSGELAEWIGEDGFAALLRRALDAEKPQHAYLVDARVVTDAEGRVSIEHTDAVADGLPAQLALGAVLARFILLFGRFVGVEMATRLTMRAWREHLPAVDPPERDSR